MWLRLDRIEWQAVPYRIGLAKPVFDDDVYATLVTAFPHEATLLSLGSGRGYNKWALSERVYVERYREYVQASPIWRELHAQIKSPDFVLMATRAAGLPVGQYSSRWEFSSMPADGGFIVPHRDTPGKVLTLVVPMLQPGDWDETWGGGTDVLVPKPGIDAVDYVTPLDDFDVASTVHYRSNQACVFLRSERSWHSVGPIRGPMGKWRRSLTINVERRR